MIETIALNWSEAREVSTKRGIRYLRTAQPTANFWAAWKSAKAAIKADGVEVNKFSGQWEVAQWLEALPEVSMETVAGATLPDNSSTGPVVASATDIAGSSPAVSIDPSVAWSAEQLAIFEWFSAGTGHRVVKARAGTGKSTTIKQGLLIARESRRLYAVFNKKNQREAVEKINHPQIDVLTLHGLGFRFIRNFWRNAKPDDYVEMDRILAASPGIPEDPANAVERLVGFAKNSFIGMPLPEMLFALANDRGIFSGLEAPEDGGWTVGKLALVAYDAMKAAFTRDSQGRISFNDMVWLPVAQNWVKPCYDLVCVDEAQDMNLPQLEMATRACTPEGRICVVGDDRQAIYGFRGAAQDGMELMRQKLNAEVLGLTITYRCPKAVVAIANEIVPDYHAAPEAPEGVVEEIELAKLVSTAQIGDAILSRLNAPLMSTCLQLLRNNVPARIEGRDVGRQLVGMVRKLKARSVPDFLRKLDAWGEKQRARVTGRNIEAKLSLIDDQVATLSAVAEGAANVAAIEAKITSLFEDSGTSTKPSVVLSSVHKAKGLEWDRVFVLVGTFRKSKGEEEANIYYVAVTRAKKTLTFVE